jgi:hypothetical protein
LTDLAPHLRTRAELLNLLGEVLVLSLEDAQSALPCYAEALSLYEGLGDMRQAWDVRMGQGICAQKQLRFDVAIDHSVRRVGRTRPTLSRQGQAAGGATAGRGAHGRFVERRRAPALGRNREHRAE